MSEITTYEQKKDRLFNLLNTYRERLDAILPAHLPVDKLVALVQNQLQSNPQLIDCAPGSVVGCIVQAAELGLEFGAKQHAHLIPRRMWDKAANAKVLRCTLLIDYRGMVHLAMASGGVKAVWAYVVREGDLFQHQLGDSPSVQHVPSMSREPADDGSDIVAAYAVVELANGRKLLEVMPRWELDKVRDSASGSRDRDGNLIGPWLAWPGRMCRKSVLRRVLNLPAVTAAPALAQAFQVDNQVEAGELTPLEVEIQRVGDDAGPPLPESMPGDDPQGSDDEARTGESGAPGGHAEDPAHWWEKDARKGTKLYVAQRCREMVLALFKASGLEPIDGQCHAHGTALLVKHLGDAYQGASMDDLPSFDMRGLRQLHDGLAADLEAQERDQDDAGDLLGEEGGVE